MHYRPDWFYEKSVTLKTNTTVELVLCDENSRNRKCVIDYGSNCDKNYNFKHEMDETIMMMKQ